MPYHHLVLSPPREIWAVIKQNREVGLNLLAAAANESIAQWARDVHGMRMGIIIVIHTFGSDLRWHPHIHLIVTGGGLSLDGKRWIETDPKYLMNHAGLKKRWKYQVVTRMKKAHRQGKFRLWGKLEKLREYKFFAGMLNRLWPLTWYAHIGAGLLDPEHSVRYAGRYTKRAVLAEYRITHYDGKTIRYAYKDYAQGGKTSFRTLKVVNFIKRLVQHIPDKGFPMVRHTGIFCNRWKKRYLSQARRALGQRARRRRKKRTWQERQRAYRGKDPLQCTDCAKPLKLVGMVFGKWSEVGKVFERAGRDASIPLLDYRQPIPT